MAISTKAELKTAIASWLAREGDTQITGNADNFITLAESRLNRDLPLRVNEGNTTLTGAVSSRALTLPSDYVEPIALWLTTFGDYEQLPQQDAGDLDFQTVNATPRAWEINGAYINLDSPCDQAHTFVFRYRASFTLASDGATNWLLTNHPDVYLYATLKEAAVFLKDPEAVQYYDGMYQIAKDEIAWKEARSKSSSVLTLDSGLTATGCFDINQG